MNTTENVVNMTVRPGGSRGVTNIGWLHSHHSFSFGQYYNPQNTRYGVLRVINDDIIGAGQGFDTHPHRDMEILTWVLSGKLRHGDSLGNMREMGPGELQAMSAGSGIEHSEFNASDTDPLHLLQIWIFPSEKGMAPRYDQKTFDATARRDQWDTLAAGGGFLAQAAGAMPIHQDAALRVVDLSAGAGVALAVNPGRRNYVHVATGQVSVSGQQQLDAGDAVTLEGHGEVTLTAAGAGAQVLWFDLP